jgi:TnpA family transposase
VINAYNKYELPHHWGSGKSASVDGTRFDMYEQNMLSEFHIRYASYGGIGYYLVSDNYIALFSRFIPCCVREAVHLIDGLMENESDIQPEKFHGDTHAQSTVVFGLAHLLGIKLMPRIKDINSLVFFKPDGRLNYNHIDSLFSGSINSISFVNTIERCFEWSFPFYLANSLPRQSFDDWVPKASAVVCSMPFGS